jgi:hypothetical protein
VDGPFLDVLSRIIENCSDGARCGRFGMGLAQIPSACLNDGEIMVWDQALWRRFTCALSAITVVSVLTFAGSAAAQGYPDDGGDYPAGPAVAGVGGPSSPGDAHFWRVSGKLSAGAMIPFGDGGYAGSPGGGMAFDAGIWAELPYGLALEVRVGLRFDLVRGEDAYAEIPLDLGMFYTLGGPIALVIGGGIGAHHIWETRTKTITVGEVITARSDLIMDDNGWGFGLFGRLGMLIRGNRRNRGGVLIAGEINTTFIELNDYKNPTSVVITASVLY